MRLKIIFALSAMILAVQIGAFSMWAITEQIDTNTMIVVALLVCAADLILWLVLKAENRGRLP